MSDDIFDKVLAQDGKGDIFDRVAAQQQAAPPSFLDAANQAKKQITSAPMQYDTSPLVTGQPDVLGQAQKSPAYNDYMKQSGSFAGTVAGGMATGGVLPAIKNLPIASKLLSAGGRALATGAGTGIGALAGGATPQEAKLTAAGGVVGQPIAEGISAAASPLVKWITSSKSLGGQLLEQASARAGQAPVELSPETNAIIDDVTRQSKLGGRAPKVVSDLLERLGPSTKQAADAVPGPLTYDEARIVQGNLSTMSVNEKNDLKGQLKYLMPKLARSFSQDVQTAADQAGVGAQHAQGMKEFAIASARNRALAKAGKATLAGAGVYGAEELIRRAAAKATGH